MLVDWQIPVFPGGLHVWPPLGVVGAVEPFDVEVASTPPKPGMLKGMQLEGRSWGQSKSVLDHLGLLESSPRSASMERETETSAALVSLTPVLDAPDVWLQRPFGSI